MGLRHLLFQRLLFLDLLVDRITEYRDLIHQLFPEGDQVAVLLAQCFDLLPLLFVLCRKLLDPPHLPVTYHPQRGDDRHRDDHRRLYQPWSEPHLADTPLLRVHEKHQHVIYLSLSSAIICLIHKNHLRPEFRYCRMGIFTCPIVS